MRNPIIVLKSLNEMSRDKTYKFQKLYRNLYNPEFYLLAYSNIYAAPGNMTPGTDSNTIDDMSMGRIMKIISSLKDHSYQPNPARRTYISKKNSNKKRPLGIPSADDKLVQEVVRMILESIYEPNFSNQSHGFRPKRSCHTALQHISRYFTGIKWFVEGDIKACFDSFDHHVLINILKRRIEDEYFIALMWKFLKAGYVDQWEYYTTYSGTAQGSGTSPILANIYLNELDTFMENYKSNFDIGHSKRRKTNPEYKSLQGKSWWLKKRTSEKWGEMSDEEKPQTKESLKNLQKQALKLPTHIAIDPSYKRIQYCRYADDWLCGVIGSKGDAEAVKEDIKKFLCEKLKLELSDEKTKVTHSSDKARFLSYDICISNDKGAKRTKSGKMQRNFTDRVKLFIPQEKWLGKLKEYNAIKFVKDENNKEKWVPIHRGKLKNKEDIEIISKFNSEIRGLYNYYSIAHNASVLHDFAHIMEYSMYKTFAAKYDKTKRQAINDYKINGEFGVNYQTKAGIKRCVFYNEGFKRKNEPIKWNMDTMPQYKKYDSPNSIAARMKRGICEYCLLKTDDVRIHHVRKLKDLKGEKAWEKLMMEKRRKTLAVCPECHQKIHDNII